MRVFRPEGAVYVARVEPAERALLLDAVDDVLALLGGAVPPSDGPRVATGPVEPPADPALRRLLPDASTDPRVAAELRRLTEQDLRATKTDHLARLRACVDGAGPELVVVPSEAPAVAAALSDVRLVLAERLGIRTDADAEVLHTLALLGPGPDADEAEQGVHLLATLHVVLGILQESLVELMLDGLPDGPALGSAP